MTTIRHPLHSWIPVREVQRGYVIWTGHGDPNLRLEVHHVSDEHVRVVDDNQIRVISLAGWTTDTRTDKVKQTWDCPQKADGRVYLLADLRDLLDFSEPTD